MKSMLMRGVCFAPDGGGGSGGGGGPEGGDLSGDALKGTSFEGMTIPAAFVKEGKADVAAIMTAASRPDPLEPVAALIHSDPWNDSPALSDALTA